MSFIKRFFGSLLMKKGLGYLKENPEENLPKIVDWLEKYTVKPHHEHYLEMAREIIDDKDNNWYQMIQRALKEINPNTLEKFLTSFVINSAFIGNARAMKMKEKHQCNVPWAILMDPTAACNLKCTGCWAAEYDKADSLSNEELDKIIRQGKKLGIYMYIYSGGEPLVRKNDLIKLADKHQDCAFLAFTNGTLIDDTFAENLARVGNFALAISVEGYEEETDLRRGKGTYQKAIKGMDTLKKYGVPFGFSTCYHSKNTEVVGSDEYMDFMVEKGCMFGWYFTYMPLGKDAVPELLASPKQREYMYHQVRKARNEKPIFLMDFWNDGEYVNGCIAGGRCYLHINASGDVEPCAFIHYSNVNIRETSLLDALKSPLFMEYHRNQPFNENHLRPCPLLDNPDYLKEMVHNSCACSTQPADKEDVDELTDKCQEIAKQWGETADRLWEKSQQKK
jgi:MoaA/NifB/PqqE/SkfB family radical SAM enzyme